MTAATLNQHRPAIQDPVVDLEPSVRDDPADLIKGLTKTPQRLIPSRYSYSDEGSRLYEELCQQPEYYLTRVERQLIQDHAFEIAAHLGVCTIYELGAGNSEKTAILLDRVNYKNDGITYCPIDINRSILEKGRAMLATRNPLLRTRPIVATYGQALTWIAESQTSRACSRSSVLFLGSTFGNFDEEERGRFLVDVRKALGVGEFFLFSSDLQKPSDILTQAYNDSAGILATMELGALEHINSLYDGDFDVKGFYHRSIYNSVDQRIESHLWSTRRQVVNLRGLSLSFEVMEGESILNDIMSKPDVKSLNRELAAAGFDVVKLWMKDPEWYAIYLVSKR